MFVFKRLNKKYPVDVQAPAYFNQEIENELIVIIYCMQKNTVPRLLQNCFRPSFVLYLFLCMRKTWAIVYL